MFRVALLDDFQRVALAMADWHSLAPAAAATAFHDTPADAAALVARLAPFDAVVLMRERTPFGAALIEALPRLKLIVTTGMYNASIDLAAATARGVLVCGTDMHGYPTAELSWGLILALARHIPQEEQALRGGIWQTSLGFDLNGKSLGIVGFGRLGTQMAKIGRAFGMDIIAWTPRLTAERAAEHGALRVEKDELFARADVVTLHVALNAASRGTVGAAELAHMKPTALLINTSRGPIVDEAALLAALMERRIAGAALDVFDREPLPAEHPLRRAPNTILTPHLGYVTERNYQLAYGGALEAIRGFLAGTPVRPLNAPAQP